MIGCFKSEGLGPTARFGPVRRTIYDVEFTTMEQVVRYNNHLLHTRPSVILR
jgi:hypothetical protein